MYYSDSRRLIELDPRRVTVWLSLLGGLMLNLLSYPDAWFAYKPDFVALILVIWALRLRRPIPFSMVFLVGILMDVAYTATLGQHAFAYSVLLGVATFLHRPYAIANRLHRAVFVFLTLAFTIGASLLVSMVFESASAEFSTFTPALIGAGAWLVMPLLLVFARSGKGDFA